MVQDKKNFIEKTLYFFDKLEDRIRGHLSKYPVIYTLIGGVAIVLFWRGVWHSADMLEEFFSEKGSRWAILFYEPTSLGIVMVILLGTGLFVSYFIGDTILMSGLKKEKKVTDHTEREVQQEEAKINQMRITINEMKKEMDVIKNIVIEEHHEHHRKDKTEVNEVKAS